MLYRRYRGSLEESMRTAIEFSTKAELLNIIQIDLQPFGVKDISFGKSVYDKRNDWQTYEVIAHFEDMKNQKGLKSIVGHTNGIFNE